MKKISYLFAVLGMVILSLQSFAQDADKRLSYPFAKYPAGFTYSSIKEEVDALRDILDGKVPEGATKLYGTPVIYSSIITEESRKEILESEDYDQFGYEYADGTERNYGVLDGGAYDTKMYFAKGTKLLVFYGKHGTIKFKIGTNLCFNPTRPEKPVDDDEPEEDGDLVDVPEKKIYKKVSQTSSGTSDSKASAIVDFRITDDRTGGRGPNNQSDKELSYQEGFKILQDGADFYKDAFDDGLKVGKESNCCDGDNTNQKQTIIRETVYRESDDGEDDGGGRRSKKEKKDGPTFMGSVLRTAAGVAIAAGVAYGAYRLLSNGQGQWYNGRGWQNYPPQDIGGPVQGGSLRPLGGPVTGVSNGNAVQGASGFVW